MSEPSRLRPQRSSFSVICRMIVAFALIAIISFLTLVILVFLVPWRVRRIRTGNRYGHMVGWLVFRLAGIRPVIIDNTGAPDGPIEGRARLRQMKPSLIVCNHASTIDMWIGMWLNPVGGCGVAKKEIVRIPFFGVIYWLTGHLLLDRSNLRRSIESMREVSTYVRDNELGLWMWPEGSRSRNGCLKPLKKGFVHLAIATRLPVVPVISHDADLMWPGRSFRVRPGRLRMEILPPIDTSSWQTETVDEHVRQVHTIMRAALSERQRGPEPTVD